MKTRKDTGKIDKNPPHHHPATVKLRVECGSTYELLRMLTVSSHTRHPSAKGPLAEDEEAQEEHQDTLKTSKRTVDLGKNTVTHTFLVMPECPYPWVDVTSYRKLFGLPSYPLRGTEREFLGAVGYYNLWILGLVEIAKPLDLSTGGTQLLN
ncbi:hypothetical protein QTO34_001284 [Cnephaeus nilssonii]|uniref:Uncharacterized protein n=1 Tax=Cnephaeus nilssonii TaxID=3371016 RepID=A0AA40HVE4_CNENI|nr:hypothetical protein QTO34_001284 [Eptesicus nilssonii]